jgi:hypothetical protein
MDNDICQCCGNEAYATVMFNIVTGHFQSDWDLSNLVLRSECAEASGLENGGICDTCIEKFISSDALVPFSRMSDNTYGINLSAAVYADLFVLGAEDAHRITTSVSDAPATTLPEKEVLEKVARIRRRISGDEVGCESHTLEEKPRGWHAYEVGYAHAIASKSCGLIGQDHDYTQDAVEWADQRRHLDEQLPRFWTELKEAEAAYPSPSVEEMTLLFPESLVSKLGTVGRWTVSSKDALLLADAEEAGDRKALEQLLIDISTRKTDNPGKIDQYTTTYDFR